MLIIFCLFIFLFYTFTSLPLPLILSSKNLDKQLWTNYHALYFAINGTHSRSPSLFVFGSANTTTSGLVTSPSQNSPASTPPSTPSTPSTPPNSMAFSAEISQEVSVFEQAVLTKLNTYPTYHCSYFSSHLLIPSLSPTHFF